ncbi:GNAT family N-acetyltransferase [Allonocardiopsis opalescens]|uniref:Acetyltransferase (GNAT) family protein n=1 Tax=Allonocardiopsis opalescens TaxID=1144618 RepID=A0A2T0PXL6_9ACTN|nr:GNAT family N-acetyltransferase [Allonocardiopsis opalescens]PRX96280.1 acetyltransferase (GNAT) family protein [Allonocardiopsis opalescens]
MSVDAACQADRHGGALGIRAVAMSDPAARPLLDALGEEYQRRYGGNTELSRFPDSDFAPPDGCLLIAERDGRTVAGGAFRRWDADTAELKRVWTAADQRRRGHARRVLAALEAEAVRRGYRRLVLNTGLRQPEAVGLYEATGYEALGEGALGELSYPYVAFAKLLPGRPAD